MRYQKHVLPICIRFMMFSFVCMLSACSHAPLKSPKTETRSAIETHGLLWSDGTGPVMEKILADGKLSPPYHEMWTKIDGLKISRYQGYIPELDNVRGRKFIGNTIMNGHKVSISTFYISTFHRIHYYGIEFRYPDSPEQNHLIFREGIKHENETWLMGSLFRNLDYSEGLAPPPKLVQTTGRCKHHMKTMCFMINNVGIKDFIVTYDTKYIVSFENLSGTLAETNSLRDYEIVGKPEYKIHIPSEYAEFQSLVIKEFPKRSYALLSRIKIDKKCIYEKDYGSHIFDNYGRYGHLFAVINTPEERASFRKLAKSLRFNDAVFKRHQSLKC
ncbi:MAG: hypothetical protein COA43_08480 [Robiginitomaculum sp.]|nr:MAG: hypothetical protein COA43_08480 [Robiginitomaculum sp.]